VTATAVKADVTTDPATPADIITKYGDITTASSWRYASLGVDAEIRYGIWLNFDVDQTSWATVTDPWMVTFIESTDALPTTGAKTAVGG